MAKKKKSNPDPEESVQENPRWILFLLFFGFAWALFVSFYFWRAFPLSTNYLAELELGSFIPKANVFLLYGRGLFVCLTTLLASFALGGLLTRRISFASSLERLVFSCASGLAFLAYFIFLLGVFQLYKREVLWGLWALTMLVTAFLWRSHVGASLKDAYQDFKSVCRSASIWTILLLALVTGIGFSLCFVPEIFYDSLVYHLGVPRFYLNEGGIKDYPIFHAKFPLTMQMLYLFGLALQGDIAAKLFHFSTGILLLLAFCSLARFLKEERAGLWGALAFLSMPMSLFNWFTTGVDVGLSFYSFLAIYSWIRSREETGLGVWLVLTGVFAGLAFGIKYTAGIIPLILAFLSFCDRGFKEKRWTLAVKESLAILAVSFLVVLPWLAKNYIHTGNPVYPFLSDFFQPRNFDPVRFGVFRNENYGFRPTGVLDWLFLPWHVSFKFLSVVLSFPGALWLAFLPLGIFFLSWRDKERSGRWFLFYSVLGLVAMWSMNRLTRYSMPFYAPLCFALGLAYHRLSLSYPRWTHLWVFVTLLMVPAQLLHVFESLHVSYKPLDVLMGREDRDDYLSYSHPYSLPLPATKLYVWAKNHLPKDSKLLILGDEKVSTCEVPFTSAGVFGVPLPVIWARNAHNTESYYEKIKQEGITHVLFNFREGTRVLNYGIFDWPEETLALFCDFWDKHVRLLKREDVREKAHPTSYSLNLYEVLPEDQAVLKPVPENGVLVLWEERHVPSDDPEARAKKLDLIFKLYERWPQIASFKQRLRQLYLEQAASQQR